MFTNININQLKQQFTPQEFRQHMLLVLVAPFGFVIFALLSIYDAWYLHDYSIALIPAFLSIVFLLSTIHYQLTKRLTPGVFLTLIAATGMLIFFINQNQNESFGLVWAVLYPPLVIMTIGHKWGLRLSLAVYIILVALLFNGLGTWQHGHWDMTSLIRFSLGYIAMTYISFVLAVSNNESYNQLKTQHINHLAEHDEIKRIATTDSLTGVYNRHHLNQLMKNIENNHLNQPDHNLIFFIMQIDWFKNYVDYYGFDQGDQLLVKISQTIVNQMKPVNGQVFRVGGSQFAGFSLSQDITKTLAQIDELQAMIAEMNIEHALSLKKKVHLSIGIVIHNQFNKFDFDKVYKTADEALFQSFEAQNHGPIVIDNRSVNLLNQNSTSTTRLQ